MNPQDPLAQLRDIQLPAAVSWWPPAPGWWLLAALLVIALLVVALLLHRRHRRNAYRRIALAELMRAEQQHRDAADAIHLAQQLNDILKRAALHNWSAAEVASLSGDQWLKFLDRHWPEGYSGDQFADTGLDTLPYSTANEPELAAQAVVTAGQWLRLHQVPRG